MSSSPWSASRNRSTVVDPRLDPRFIAGVDMVRRTGVSDIQIRYDDEQEPIVWVAARAPHVAAVAG